jgi:hypothetical protein
MKNKTSWVSFAAALLLAAGIVSAEKMDDSVLVEQIVAAVRQYRVVVKDLEALRSGLQHNMRPGSDVSAHPKVQSFIEYTVIPTEREMRRLFARYETEYGLKPFRKLAGAKGFGDLLAGGPTEHAD